MIKVKSAILGAGSWGIAIANHCAKCGHEVSMWEFDPQAAERIDKERVRPEVLKDIKILDSINISSDMSTVVADADIVYLVVPSHVARPVIKSLKMDEKSIFVGCAKGIENDTLDTIADIAKSDLPNFDPQKFAVLSGPSHAEEVSHEIPTAVVVASENEKAAQYIQTAMSNEYFRVYTSDDVMGVELGGALKNVIAIAAGICDGAGFGDNTKAALQPRGLAEMSRLGRKMGANPLTFAGLSGMGDLIVTCMSQHSRNRYVGEEIGKGKNLDTILSEMTMVAEGVRTAKSVVKLAEKFDVDMPISQEVFQVLFHDKNPTSAMRDLMTRDVKPEVWY